MRHRSESPSKGGSVRSVDTQSFMPLLPMLYFDMTSEDIEKAVEQLAPQELARFRAWFEAFDAQQFDAAIERDAQAGKLDALADEALAAHRASRFA